MSIKTVIGLDIGHSQVKVLIANTREKAERKQFSFPTLVSAWQQFSDETTAEKSKEDAVEVNGRRFFVGKTVQVQDNPQAFVGIHADWYSSMSDQYSALTKAAFQKSRRFIDQGPGEIIVVCGLPASSSLEAKKQVKELTTSLLSPLVIFGEALKVIVGNQATALINHVIFKEDGALNPDFRFDQTITTVEVDGETIEKDLPASTYGVIEVGFLTTDYTIRVGTQEVQSSTSSDFGVYKAFERLQAELQKKGYSHDLQSVNDALIEKKLNGQDLHHTVQNATSDLIQQAVTKGVESFGRRRLDGILVAGGGAGIIYEHIKKSLPTASVIRLPNSRFSVAEGYVRRGLAETHA